MIWVDCAQCAGKTNHLVAQSVDLSSYDEDAGIHYEASYQIIACQGCNRRSYRTVTSNSDDFDYENDSPIVREELYPEHRGVRAVPFDYLFGTVPDQLSRVYDETVKALNSSQTVLCGMGARAILETVVKDQKASGKNLAAQIDSLAKAGMLTHSGALILHQIRALGNKAAHEVVAHSTEELRLALDVIDNLLQAVYVLPQRAANIFIKPTQVPGPETAAPEGAVQA
jgi:hypothetical protein